MALGSLNCNLQQNTLKLSIVSRKSAIALKKKTLLLVFLIFVLFALSGCQSAEVNTPKETYPEPDLAVLAEKIIELGHYPEMLAIGESRLPKFYNIDTELLESFVVYICAEAIRSDEIVLLRAKDVKDVEKLQKNVETRLSAQKKSFDDYLPKEGEKIAKVIQYISHKDLVFVITESKYLEDITTLIETAYQPD